MEKFKSLSKDTVNVNEEKILASWKKMDILNKTIENRKDCPNFVFYDGPATANGHPGLHHMVAKFLKDTFCKYKTMQGYKVIRKVGWDTHGLPVEVEVEKELGFTNKNDIEKYGIDKFNKKCKESVRRNEKTFTDLTDKMGQFIDTDNPYVTYNNDYIETEWWILKKFFDEGLFYEGSKILPYCTRCGTGLASHEVAQGYKEVDVDSVIVPMKLKDRDAYFLVWTTTPWTLLANVALCVHPNYEYVEVNSKGYTFIIAKSLLHQVLGDDVEVVKEYTGKDLEYIEYEQLLPFLSVNKKAFFVCCDEYVTAEDGTGIVHIAPAFGAEDANVGKKYNLPYLNPVGEDGCYTDGPWTGVSVFEADKEVIKYLKENDKLFKKIKLTHNYPHCWRCGTPLLYYSKPSYYLEVTKIKDKIIEENNKVNWFPSYVGEKRFGNWLENMNDWAISRNRYWGTPLPLWICECGHQEMIGSREELVEKSIEKIDLNIDLHRPYVDSVHIRCPHCGKEMTRTQCVIDCWFDSGSMPFSQYHYPFENKEFWKTQFPADYICEGIDQTRGWFYSLLVISVFVTGKSPYKNVLVNDLLLDKEGKKMSKSKGNIVEPFTTMKTYGADAVRWYLPYVSPVWTPLKFDIDGVKEVNSKFFNTLKNTYTFFEMYANTDEVDPRKFEVDYKDLEDIDKWLLSKYNNLVIDVTKVMDEYDVNKAVHLIQYFVCEELSNWYIRRNRRRFWGSKLDNSKKAVYKTTYDVLVGVCKLIAPISPFISEEIYRNLTGEKSVHLADYPKANKKLIDNKLEEKMDLVIELISSARNIREEAKIKVRQPISEVIFEDKYKKMLIGFEDLFKEELNVKNIVWAKNISDYVSVEYKPNFKEVGKLFGSNMSKFSEYLTNITQEDIKVLESGKLHLTFDGIDYLIEPNYVIKNIKAKEGYNAVMLNYKTVVINSTLTSDLINEGLAREIVSKIQNLRKTSDFNITDRIDVKFSGPKEIKDAVKAFKKYIMSEVLALTFTEDENADTLIKINDYDMKISLKQVK
ncbi:MAG: isoleucine--tRNA ligase [Bacilli bacterium]